MTDQKDQLFMWKFFTGFSLFGAAVMCFLLCLVAFGKSQGHDYPTQTATKANNPEKVVQGTSRPAYAALLRNHKTGMSWLVTVQPNSRKMRVQAIGHMIKTPNLRLWLKPANGTPIMIGKMPMFQQSNSIKLSKRLVSFMSRNADLLVTKGIKNPSQHSSLKGHIKLKAYIYHRFNDKRG